MDKMMYNQNGRVPVRNNMSRHGENNFGYGVEENLRMRNDVMAQRREMERTNTGRQMGKPGMRYEQKDEKTGMPVRTSMPGMMSPMPGESALPQMMMEGMMPQGPMAGSDQDRSENMRQSMDMRRMGAARDDRREAMNAMDRDKMSATPGQAQQMNMNVEDKDSRPEGAGVFAQEQAMNISPLGSSKFLKNYMGLMSRSN